MVNVQTFSAAGSDRTNEDAFGLRPHPQDPDLWVCFVADGQGGRAGGGAAAQIACETGLEAATRCPPKRLGESRVWVEVLRSADEAVRAEPAAGFTTIVGLCVCRTRLTGASTGDSAAILVTPKRTVVLTAGQRKDPPVGSGFSVAVPFSTALNEPWQVLAMTDGVWKYVGWGRVVEAARRNRGAPLVADLQTAARLPGSGRFPDDFTVVVLEGSGS